MIAQAAQPELKIRAARAIVFVLRCIVIAFWLSLLAGVVFVAASLVRYSAEDRATHGFLHERIDAFAALGVNPIELSLLALHPVERVCLGAPYDGVRNAAANYGLAYDAPLGAVIPEGRRGLFVVGPEGAVTYGALHASEFTSGWWTGCFTGARLAIRFATLDPRPAGGILVDLAAPDPAAEVQPTLAGRPAADGPIAGYGD